MSVLYTRENLQWRMSLLISSRVKSTPTLYLFLEAFSLGNVCPSIILSTDDGRTSNRTASERKCYLWSRHFHFLFTPTAYKINGDGQIDMLLKMQPKTLYAFAFYFIIHDFIPFRQNAYEGISSFFFFYAPCPFGWW